MKISSRFAEYGMTGVFFWVSQLVVLVVLNPDVTLVLWNQWWQTTGNFANALPKNVEASAASLIAVFGIISVFFAGLVLDLLGSWFMFWEMVIFGKHVARNKGWMDDATGQFGGSLQEDYVIVPATLAVGATFFMVSAFITLRAYRRMCFLLFALACTTYRRHTMSLYQQNTQVSAV